MRRWIDEARPSSTRRSRSSLSGRRSTATSRPSLPPLDPEAVGGAPGERFVRSSRPILDGQLSELRALDELTVETELERRDTVIADLDGTRLVFEGRELRFPERLARGARVPRHDDGPFGATDLPGTLDDAGRLVLLRRLVREGFLRRSGSAA